MKKAEILEGGTSMSLQDAESIASADVKFPSTAYFAGEKLHGWSVVIDILGLILEVFLWLRTA